MELFILTKDPGKVMLTTDHPNAGPFILYPRIIGAVKNLEVKCQKVFSDLGFLFYVFIRDITPLLIFINLLTLLGKVF